jgi:ABC-type nitrate/sulfonate/bicarbonate transport system substrate-binding protein
MRALRAVAAVITAWALCGAPPAHAQPKQEIRWGAPVIASSYYWDVWAAIALGYMDQEGLSIKVINNDTPIQSLQFLATGAIDISSPNTEVAISAIDKGADFSFVAAEDALIGFVLVTRPEINTYADLRGKTLGVTQLHESTATMIRLLLEHNGVKPTEYQTIALGGSPNRYAALVRGAVAATMLSPPFDLKAVDDGMKKLGDAFEVFRGVGVVFAVSNAWARAHADALVGFLRAAAKAQSFLYDPKNKDEAVTILVKVTKSPREDIAKSYDSFYGATKIMAPDLELTEAAIKPWLDLRGSSEQPARYMDLSYWRRALGR